jgi:hypothetical protein
MIDPSQISCEDDIVLMLKSQIRKTKEVTPTQWEVFQQLPKVLTKNKDSFGSLFETINYFLCVGKIKLAEEPENLKTLYLMADRALFTKNPNQTINNSEGAIMIQLLFQVMTGSTALDSIFEEILNRVGQRMQDTSHMPTHLKKHILGIFMSALNYNSQLTVQYLESKSMTAGLIQELSQIKSSFTHEYEKKVFVIGLSRMLQCQILPQSLQPLLVSVLNELIEMLSSLHSQVSKRIAAAHAKEVKKDEEDSNEDDSDDSDEDDDDEDEEGEESEEKKANGTESAQEDGKATDMDAEIDDNANTATGAKDNAEPDLTDDDEDTSDFDHMFDLKITIDMMKSPFKDADENHIFCAALRSLSERAPEDLNMIISQFSAENKAKVTNLLASTQFQFVDKQGEVQRVQRKIVRVRRRAGGPTPGVPTEQPLSMPPSTTPAD